MEKERDYYEHLVKIMLQTRGVRFSVAEIEKKKDRNSIITIAFLSVYLVAWSIVTISFPEKFTTEHIKALSLISSVASISLLVISLFDYAAGRSVFAEKMLQNAFAITVVVREMERILSQGAPDYSRLAELAARYEEIIVGAGVNHESVHFRMWKFEKRDPANFFERAYLRIAKPIRRTAFLCWSSIFQIILVASIFAATSVIILRILYS